MHLLSLQRHALGPLSAWLRTYACSAGLTVVAACDQIGEPIFEDTRPGQVVVSIAAGEEVAARASLLRVKFASLAALPEPASESAEELDLEDVESSEYRTFEFPYELRIPDELLQQGAAFWVEVVALEGSDQVLATTRLISAQQSGRVLEPTLMLNDVCLDVICGMPTYTCSKEGFCARAVRAPEGLESRPLD